MEKFQNLEKLQSTRNRRNMAHTLLYTRVNEYSRTRVIPSGVNIGIIVCTKIALSMVECENFVIENQSVTRFFWLGCWKSEIHDITFAEQFNGIALVLSLNDHVYHTPPPRGRCAYGESLTAVSGRRVLIPRLSTNGS